MDNDPFALLGLPREYELTAGAMQAAYLRLSATLHPDRVRDPVEQQAAAARAAQLNDARAILVNDERRADALLRLVGGPSKEQLKALPDGFLQEMMQVRMEMEEALAGGTAAERSRLEQWAMNRR